MARYYEDGSKQNRPPTERQFRAMLKKMQIRYPLYFVIQSSQSTGENDQLVLQWYIGNKETGKAFGAGFEDAVVIANRFKVTKKSLASTYYALAKLYMVKLQEAK